MVKFKNKIIDKKHHLEIKSAIIAMVFQKVDAVASDPEKWSCTRTARVLQIKSSQVRQVVKEFKGLHDPNMKL
jgi:hypothetical protein